MSSLILLLSAHLLVLCIQTVSSHSWIACTDYLEQNGHYWDPALCRAFPRHAARYTPRSGQFGADKGYDIINPPEDAPCRTSRDDVEAYDADHPMAVYFPGQIVVIVHPTKVGQVIVTIATHELSSFCCCCCCCCCQCHYFYLFVLLLFLLLLLSL